MIAWDSNEAIIGPSHARRDGRSGLRAGRGGGSDHPGQRVNAKRKECGVRWGGDDTVITEATNPSRTESGRTMSADWSLAGGCLLTGVCLLSGACLLFGACLLPGVSLLAGVLSDSCTY